MFNHILECGTMQWMIIICMYSLFYYRESPASSSCAIYKKKWFFCYTYKLLPNANSSMYYLKKKLASFSQGPLEANNLLRQPEGLNPVDRRTVPLFPHLRETLGGLCSSTVRRNGIGNYWSQPGWDKFFTQFSHRQTMFIAPNFTDTLPTEYCLKLYIM